MQERTSLANNGFIVGETFETVNPLILPAVNFVSQLSLCGTKMVRQGTARRCLSFCLMLEQRKPCNARNDAESVFQHGTFCGLLSTH
jgi:hypothetical protein